MVSSMSWMIHEANLSPGSLMEYELVLVLYWEHIHPSTMYLYPLF
jgi:hypothetical protein